MQFEEAREHLIQSWGTLGSQWGINRTMAQIHALLMVTKRPLSAEDIMEILQISRGNANMNVRALIDWGLVQKTFKSGERREFFVAEKDIWEVFRRVTAERKKRELEPVVRALDKASKVDKAKNSEVDPEEVKEFTEMVGKLQEFVVRMDKLTERVAKADRNWFFKAIMRLMR